MKTLLYYIDGYNFIFSISESNLGLSQQRKNLISYLQHQFSSYRLKGLLVFDGKHKVNEESGFSYATPLEIAYAPAGQTADQFILEKLEWEKQKSQITVVTNDRGLIQQARCLGAKTMANELFIRFLQKKDQKEQKIKQEIKETETNLKRLLKIFEKKFRDLDE